MSDTKIWSLYLAIVSSIWGLVVSNPASCATLNPAAFASNACHGAVDYSFYLPSNYTLGKSSEMH